MFLSLPPFLLLLQFLLALFPTDAPVNTWNYPDTEAWVKRYPLCGGPLQSPIALNRAQVASAPPPRVVADSAARKWKVRVKNNGRRVALEMTADSKTRAKKPRFPLQLRFENGVFNLLEVHFHHGDRFGSPGSEHSIGGKLFDAEAHFVFFESSFSGLEEAQKVPGMVTVVGVPLSRRRRGKQNGVIFPTFGLEKRLRRVARKDDSFTFRADLRKLRTLLRQTLPKVFAYYGSSTTPPCFPTFAWRVSAVKTTISSAFLNGLTTKIFQDRSKTKLLVNNRRPLQSRDGRPIVLLTDSRLAYETAKRA